MKKLLILVLFLLPSSINLSAQIEKLYSETYTIRADLDLIKEKAKVYNFSIGASLSLQADELHIHYQFWQLTKFEYYNTSLKILLDGEEIKPSTRYLMGDVGKELSKGKSGSRQTILWTSLSENYQQLKGRLTIIVSVDFYGKKELPHEVDCAHPPQFGFKQKLPLYSIGAVGLGSIVTGQVLRINADNIYENQYLPSNRLDIRAETYEEYEQKLDNAKLLTYAGIGVVVADAVLWLIRNRKHNQRLRTFEKNCDKVSISFQPIYEISTNNESQLGMGLILKF